MAIINYQIIENSNGLLLEIYAKIKKNTKKYKIKYLFSALYAKTRFLHAAIRERTPPDFSQYPLLSAIGYIYI